MTATKYRLDNLEVGATVGVFPSFVEACSPDWEAFLQTVHIVASVTPRKVTLDDESGWTRRGQKWGGKDDPTVLVELNSETCVPLFNGTEMSKLSQEEKTMFFFSLYGDHDLPEGFVDTLRSLWGGAATESKDG